MDQGYASDRQQRSPTYGGLALSAVLMNLTLSACWSTERVVQIKEPFVAAKHRAVQVERCVDRTGVSGIRNLATEATDVLRNRLKASGLFQIRNEAQVVLTCDLKHFAEGNTLRRWLMPGSGVAHAGVTVMVWELPGQRVLATLQSRALVEAGSSPTTVSDESILDEAVTDIVTQLQRWATGAEPD